MLPCDDFISPDYKLLEMEIDLFLLDDKKSINLLNFSDTNLSTNFSPANEMLKSMSKFKQLNEKIKSERCEIEQ